MLIQCESPFRNQAGVGDRADPITKVTEKLADIDSDFRIFVQDFCNSSSYFDFERFSEAGLQASQSSFVGLKIASNSFQLSRDGFGDQFGLWIKFFCYRDS